MEVADADPMAQAKRPSSALAGRYGHPVHPALVALPIGAWVASLVFDAASHLADDPAPAATGARWLIGIGVIGAVVAALAGSLDLFTLRPGTRVFRTALIHLTLALTGTAGFAVGFAARGDPPAAPVPGWAVALSVASLATIGGAGYLGGMLAYRYGVRVADERTQAEGYRRPGPPDPTPQA